MALHLTVVTPHGQAYQGEVERVVLPGTEGRFGVLEGHERFLAPLTAGEVEIQAPGDVLYAAVSGGFADVAGDQLVVLAEACELAHDIDVARAERAHHEARGEVERLEAEQAEESDFLHHKAAVERAVVRMEVAGKRR